MSFLKLKYRSAGIYHTTIQQNLTLTMATDDSRQCAHFVRAAWSRDKSDQNERADEPPPDAETLEFDDNDSFGKGMAGFLKDVENDHHDKPARLHARIKSDETENILNLLTREVLESPAHSASLEDSSVGEEIHMTTGYNNSFGCPSFSATLSSMFKTDSFDITKTALDTCEEKHNHVASKVRSTHDLSFKMERDSKQFAKHSGALPPLPVLRADTGAVYIYQNVWGVNTAMQLPAPSSMLISGTTRALSKRKRDSEEFSPAIAAESGRAKTSVGLDLLCTVSADFGPRLAFGCRCSRTRCLKLYCDCFQAGRICTSSCSCISCLNIKSESGEHGERTKAIYTILSRKPDAFQKKDKSSKMGCACRNSKCLKKYCVCFSEKILCGSRCVCTNCLNITGIEGVTGSRESVEDTASGPLISQLNDEDTANV